MDIKSSVKQEVRGLWGDGDGMSLLAISGTWGLLLGSRMIYPVILPHLRESFSLSLTAVGFLVTILWMGSALGQLPGGLLADRTGERLILAAGTMVVGFALLLVVLSPTALLLYIATGLLGLGQSVYPIARITILSDLYPDQIGSALGVTMAMGDLGQTVLPLIAGILAAAIFWQAGFGFVIPLLLVSAVCLWLVLPGKNTADEPRQPLSRERGRAVLHELRRTDIIFVAVVLFLYMLIWQAFTGFYPTYLVEQKGLSSSTAGILLSLFFGMGVLIKPVAGAMYDRLGAGKTLGFVLIGPAFALVGLPLVECLWSLFGLTIVISSMLGSGAITQSFLSDALPEDLRGTGLGVIRTIVAACGALGPVIFGMLADNGYFDEGYFLLAIVLFIVMVASFRAPISDNPTR